MIDIEAWLDTCINSIIYLGVESRVPIRMPQLQILAHLQRDWLSDLSFRAKTRCGISMFIEIIIITLCPTGMGNFAAKMTRFQNSMYLEYYGQVFPIFSCPT